MQVVDNLKILSDEELMQRIIDRDKLAFGELYDRYSSRLMAYFMKMLWNNRDLAEDLLQDLFMKIARQPELFDTSRVFKPWVYTVANNLCKMEYRKSSKRAPSVSLEKAPEISDASHKIAEQVDRKAFTRKLKEVLESIKEPHKSTFVLRYFEELSLKEIAQIHSCSEGTVKSRLFYTLRNIASKMPQFQHLSS
jgi:RNA polymerase sigma-70 factor (ECF subfamily)